MKSLVKFDSGSCDKDSNEKRDALLLKLLRTPHQPRPKRGREKAATGTIAKPESACSKKG